jgi:4-amino-4-deoxy-L-arabinose transferase-like glycosyltransferase
VDTKSIILISLLLVVFCVWLDWLLVYKLKLFAKNQVKQEKLTAAPVEKSAIIIDFFIGIILLGIGQYIISSSGRNDFAISQWLTRTFYLAVDNMDNILIGSGLIVAGVFLLLRKVWAEKQSRRIFWHFNWKRDLSLFPSRPPLRMVMVALVFFIALVSSLYFQAYSFVLPILWITVILLTIIWVIRWDVGNRSELRPGIQAVDLQSIFSISLIGLLVLTFKLRDFPAELIGDEGGFWSLAKLIASGTEYPPIFNHGVYSFGMLSSYFQAGLIRIFGDGLWGWRFSSVMTAVMAIPAIYLLAREMFDRKIGLAAAFSFISLPFLIAFSRLGYNNIQAVLIVAWSVYLFYAGYLRKNYTYILLSGIISGLGIYSYPAAMGGFFAIILFMLFLIITSPRNRTVLINQIAILLIGFFIIAVPYIVNSFGGGGGAIQEKPVESLFFNSWYGHDLFSNLPEYQNAITFQMHGNTLFFSPGLWVILLIRGFFRTILSFQSPFLVTEHFIYSPLAGPISVVFYLVGLLRVFYKRWEPRSLFLGLWFLINITAFSALNTFPPRQTHLVGIIPLFCVLISVGLFAVIDQIKKLIPRISSKVISALGVLGVSVIVISGIWNYFYTVPLYYKPDFEQIVSWYSIYVKDAGITYVHADGEKPDPKLFFFDKIMTNVPYHVIPVSKYMELPQDQLIAPDMLYFFTDESYQTARTVLPDISSGKYILRSFTDEGERVIVRGLWLTGTQLFIPTSFSEIFKESYLHPAVPTLTAIFVLFLFLIWLYSRSVVPLPKKVVASFAWLSAGSPAESPHWLGNDRSEVPGRTEKHLPNVRESLARFSLSKPASIKSSAPQETQAVHITDELVAPELVTQHNQPEPVVMPGEHTAEQVVPMEDKRPFISLEIKLRINLPYRQSEKSLRLPPEHKSIRRPIIKLPVDRYLGGVKNWFNSGWNRVMRLSTQNIVTWLMIIGIAVIVGLIGEYGTVIKTQLLPNIWFILAGAFVVAIALNCMNYYPVSAVERNESVESFRFSEAIRQRILIFAIVISLLGISLLRNHPDDTPYWDVFAIWIFSILIAMAAYIPKQFSFSVDIKKIDWKGVLPIILILIIGGFLRFYQLGHIPFIMENDEGTVGVKALEVLSGIRRNMFDTFGGFGSLHLFLMAIPVYLFGRTILSVRLLTALMGFLTLPVVYLLAKEMFSKKIALVSTFLLAVSHLHIQFSRISPTTSLDPFLSSLAFLFLYRGFRDNRRRDWVYSALVMGLGLYFYVGARAMMVVSFGYILYMLVFHWKDFKKNIKNLPAYLLTFIIVSAPMLYWFYINPDAFNARINQVGIFQTGWAEAEMINRNISLFQVLREQFVSAVLIFFFSLPRWFYEAQIPALHIITGFLFACGILVTIVRIKDMRYGLIQCWFWATLISGQVLLVDPPPNAYRTLGLYPTVCMFGGIALVWLIDSWSSVVKGKLKYLPTIVMLVALAVEGYLNVQYYFGNWAPQYLYGDRRSRTESLVGAYVGKLPDETVTYIADSESYWGSGSPSFDYQSNDHPYVDVKGSLLDVIPEVKESGRALFILPEERYDEMYVLQRELPGGEVYYQYLGNDVYFMAYRYGL